MTTPDFFERRPWRSDVTPSRDDQKGRLFVSQRRRSSNVQSAARTNHDESGAVLILAMIFLVVVSSISLALASWSTNDLNNTSKFAIAQSFQSAANSATEIALENVRYNFLSSTINASPPAPCWTTSPTPSSATFNGEAISVWCSTRWVPLSQSTRTVTFSACLSTVSASACEAAPLLHAVVSFNDYPSPIGPTDCAPGSVAGPGSTCGVGMSIVSWVFDAVPPIVTSVATYSGTTSCATTPVIITGTGFSGATGVDFIVSSQFNAVFAGTIESESSTSIVACTPSNGSGNAFVTVTTPVGTSPQGPTYNY
ncbi:MAG: hypothetical protein ACYCPT_01460 [Acidimicrobiales bacterium]